MRNVLFISHANPEDNEFSIWLASRLQMMGYEVWIDKNALLGGEKFWEDIDLILRHNVIKFLLIYSENILYKKERGRLRDGISKEVNLAESISKHNKLQDYMVLLNIDGSQYDLFIGADRLNQIQFYENWADGLKQLLKKLQKDNIQKSNENNCGSLGDWYENMYTTKNGIIQKKELYYTSWWPIVNLPKSFYIYQFDSEDQASALFKKDNPYPVAKTSNIIATFDGDFNFNIEHEGETTNLNPLSIYEIDIMDVIMGYDRKEFPSCSVAVNHLKYLLNRVFHQIMKNRGMEWYFMANYKIAYFYTTAILKSGKVSFEYQFRNDKRKKKTKHLIGKYLSLGKWHFAISNRTILKPIISFNLKSHIIFTENGYRVWNDKNKIHSHRRSKGKTFFNAEWRDMLFAFLHGLKDLNGQIKIQLNKDTILTMNPWTELFWSNFGYYEPRTKDRLGILSEDEEFEIEEYELSERDGTADAETCVN